MKTFEKGEKLNKQKDEIGYRMKWMFDASQATEGGLWNSQQILNLLYRENADSFSFRVKRRFYVRTWNSQQEKRTIGWFKLTNERTTYHVFVFHILLNVNVNEKFFCWFVSSERKKKNPINFFIEADEKRFLAQLLVGSSICDTKKPLELIKKVRWTNWIAD